MLPIESIYGIFTYIYHKKSTIHEGKYAIDGWYGLVPWKGSTYTDFPPRRFVHVAACWEGGRCDEEVWRIILRPNPNIPRKEHTLGIPKLPNDERNSFINCWLRVRGMFDGVMYVGKILRFFQQIQPQATLGIEFAGLWNIEKKNSSPEILTPSTQPSISDHESLIPVSQRPCQKKVVPFGWW